METIIYIVCISLIINYVVGKLPISNRGWKPLYIMCEVAYNDRKYSKLNLPDILSSYDLTIKV